MPIELPDPNASRTSPPAGAFDVPVPGEPPAVSAAASLSADAPRPARPFSVGFGIAAATLISLLAIGVLYYKWYKDKIDPNEPVIAVWGDPSWAGAKVTVRSVTTPDWVASGTLEEQEHVLIRFHVPAGVSKLRVEKDGKVLAEREAQLGPNIVWWPFRKPEAVTRQSQQ